MVEIGCGGLRCTGVDFYSNLVFSFSYIINFLDKPTGHTGEPILAVIFGSNDVFWRKVAPFGGRIEQVTHLGGHIPQKPPKRGVVRDFPAKSEIHRNSRNSAIY